jgi:hypothetical protein
MGAGDIDPPYEIQEIREKLAEIEANLKGTGITAGIGFRREASGSGRLLPIIKSMKVGDIVQDAAVQSVARANPGNISEVAASQLAISNTYYNSVLAQAKQSFTWAIIAAGTGLIFFVSAISFLLAGNSAQVSIISVISGGLVEVISAINFWLYRQTSQQLDFFHSRLEQTQRLILANTVCENISQAKRDETRAELVHTIAQSIKNTGFPVGRTRVGGGQPRRKIGSAAARSQSMSDEAPAS